MILPKGIERRRLALVVEDQEINQGILESILEDDYDVIFADNGAEALEVIQAHLSQLSIVLLDLVMPVMNGFEVLERMREDAQMHAIPVIVMTSEEDAELRALQLGAADFITKPFDQHEVILARVGRIIELSEGRQLIQATEYDPLTRLYNRGFFFEYAEQILRFHPTWELDAVVVNIERFHSINDLNGREFGDGILKLLGNGVHEFMETTDGIASRIEADKFYLLCRHRQEYHSVLAMLQGKVNETSNRITVRLRMGVCPWTPGESVTTMFDRAKTACNMLRGSYKDHLMVYDDTFHKRELYLQRLLNDLWDAVKEHQFVVYFQPKYDIQSTPPVLKSAEALVRWVHPELGMISPGDFIPLFERNGLIHVVDSYVWERAILQVARWRDVHGIELPISVNLSRTEVFDPSLEENLTRLINENGLNPRDLKLELTESAYTDDSEQLIVAIERLRTCGFEIEMDDFGTGYSSLNMISTLPLDVLKMDMRFIQNVENDDKTFRLIELVLDIARFLDVPVVAEGVETESQLRLLKEAGCALVQGYYFSPPLPPEKFEKLLADELGCKREGAQR